MSLEVLDYTGLQNYNLAEVKDLGGRNLLINGDFQINQRGQTSYANLAKGQYCLDMWKNTNGNTQNLTAQKVDDGIKLTTTDQRVCLMQIMPDVNPQGKTYTACVSVNGRICKPITWENINNSNWDLRDLQVGDETIGSIALQAGTSFDKLTFEIYLQGQSNIINYCDLFEGSIAYPHVKEDYAIALARCQNWILNTSVTLVKTFNYPDSNQYLFEFGVSQLNSTPTLLVLSGIIYCNDNSPRTFSMSECAGSFFSKNRNYIILRLPLPISPNAFGAAALIVISCEPQ